MRVHNDIEGWQNKQFLGQGEFTVGFGNFDVAITVPSDHLVAATGEIQNTTEVLTKEQIALLAKAKNERVQPVIIASQNDYRSLVRVIEKRDLDLARQLRRAASSVVLNTAAPTISQAIRR